MSPLRNIVKRETGACARPQWAATLDEPLVTFARLVVIELRAADSNLRTDKHEDSEARRAAQRA